MRLPEGKVPVVSLTIQIKFISQLTVNSSVKVYELLSLFFGYAKTFLLQSSSSARFRCDFSVKSQPDTSQLLCPILFYRADATRQFGW